METTLDKYGRIVVPKPLRDELGIEAGTQLTLEVEQDRLVLKPVNREVLEEREGLLVSTADVDEDVDVQAVIDEVRTRRTVL